MPDKLVHKRNVKLNVNICLILLVAFMFIQDIQGQVITYLEPVHLTGCEEIAAQFSSIKTLSEFDSSRKEGHVVLLAGRISNDIIADLLRRHSRPCDLQHLGDQGYWIISLNEAECRVTLITANSQEGVLYGLIKIKEFLGANDFNALREKQWSMETKPAFTYRSTGPYANFLQYWGNFTAEDFSMEDFPQLFASEEIYLKWVEGSYKRLKQLRQEVLEAHAYGKKVYMHTRGPIYPYHIERRKERFDPAFSVKLRQLHPEIFATLTKEEEAQGISQYFCWSSDILRQIVVKNYEIIFRTVPELDGIIIVVHNGRNGYLNCHCPQCSKLTGYERLQDFLNVITEAMRKYNPHGQIILRDWGLGPLGVNIRTLAESFPSDLMYFTKLTVPPGSDYLWYDHFTPRIGTPRLLTGGMNGFHSDDGMSGHMFYLGGKLKERGLKMLEYGVEGIWSSTNPYGCADLNVWAADEASWDVRDFDPRRFLEKWSIDNFGQEAGERVVMAFHDSHRITDFLVVDEYSTNTSQVFHWDPNRPSQYGQAVAQNDELKNVDIHTYDELLKRYKGVEALERGRRMVEELAQAHQLQPANQKLADLLQWARATDFLLRTTSNYHSALLNYNLFRNTSSISAERARSFLETAGNFILAARSAKDQYIEVYSSIPGTTTMQGLRYRSFVGEEVENGYDAVYAALSGRTHNASASTTITVADWDELLSKEKICWQANHDLTIPGLIKRNEVLRIPLLTEMDHDAILRIQLETSGKSGWSTYHTTQAEIFVDGEKSGEINRGIQGNILTDHPENKSATPGKCWRSFIISRRPGVRHVIELQPKKNHLLIHQMEWCRLEN